MEGLAILKRAEIGGMGGEDLVFCFLWLDSVGMYKKRWMASVLILHNCSYNCKISILYNCKISILKGYERLSYLLFQASRWIVKLEGLEILRRSEDAGLISFAL